MAFAETMAALGAILKTVDKTKEMDPVQAAKEYEYAQKAISAKAKKAICIYDVLITNGLADYDSYFSVLKFLEAQYSAFTLIAAGLNQIVEENQSILQVIDNITTENYNQEFIKEIKDHYRKFGKKEKDYLGNEILESNLRNYNNQLSMEELGQNILEISEIKILKNYITSDKNEAVIEIRNNWDPQYKEGETSLFANISSKKSEPPDRIKVLYLEVYACIIIEEILDDILSFAIRSNSDQVSVSSNFSNIESLRKIKKDAVESGNFNTIESIIKKELVDSIPVEKIEKDDEWGVGATKDGNILKVRGMIKKMEKLSGTVLDITVSRAGIGSMSLTLLIKTSPVMLTITNMMNLFDFLNDNATSIRYKFAQVTSGRKRFFRDFLFQVDKAKRDRDLYAALGEHPYFRKLLDQKNMSRFKALIKAIINKNETIPPTASLICTVEEITSAMRIVKKRLFSNDKRVFQLVEKSFLLCLGIVDPDTELVKFYFNGLNKPILYNLRDISEKSHGNDKKMLNIIEKMTGKI